jgi:hypothetical protein
MVKHIKIYIGIGVGLSLLALGSYCLVKPVSSLRVKEISFDKSYSILGQSIEGRMNFETNFPCTVKELVINDQTVSFKQEDSSNLTFSLVPDDPIAGVYSLGVSSMTVSALGFTKTLRDSSSVYGRQVLIDDKYDQILEIDPETEGAAYPTVNSALSEALSHPSWSYALILPAKTFEETLNVVTPNVVDFFGFPGTIIDNTEADSEIPTLSLMGHGYFNAIKFVDSYSESSDSLAQTCALSYISKPNETATFINCSFVSNFGSAAAVTLQGSSTTNLHSCYFESSGTMPTLLIQNNDNTANDARRLVLKRCIVSAGQSYSFQFSDLDSGTNLSSSYASLETLFVSNSFASALYSEKASDSVLLEGEKKKDVNFLVGRVSLDRGCSGNNVAALNYRDSYLY